MINKLKKIRNNPAKSLNIGLSKIAKNKNSNTIFINCFPKSGSSFVTSVLREVTDFKINRIVYKFLQNEQDLYLPSMIDGTLRNTITQQHTRATEPNLELLNQYGIKPVILLRNMFDVVVSLRDYMIVAPKTFLAYITDDFYKLSKDKQFDFVIEFMLPWYFYFYTSWINAKNEKKISTYWTTYEEMNDDKFLFFKKILQFYNVTYLDTKLEKILSSYND